MPVINQIGILHRTMNSILYLCSQLGKGTESEINIVCFSQD